MSTITANQVRPRGAQSGKTVAAASHENERLRQKNKTEKKGDMNKREGGHAVKIDGMVIASCLLMAGLQVCQ